MQNLEYKIVNIVATGHTRKLNLEKLSDELGVEYNPKVFPAARYHSWKPPASVLLFESGKMVCTGCKTKRDVKKVFRKITKEIGEVYEEKLETPSINIVNMVASSNIGLELDLDDVCSLLRKYGRAIYEPEIFSGLVFWPFEEKRTLILLFNNGKVICEGAKEESTIMDALGRLSKILEEHNRTTSNT